MPIEDKELKAFVSEFLDIDVEKVEDLDSLKTNFSEVFARKDTYKSELLADKTFLGSINGKAIGSITTKIKKIAKEDLGLELDATEVNDKTPEEIFATIASKTKGKYEGEITELKKKFTTEPNELVKEWEDKFKIKAQEADQWKNQASQIGNDFETFKTTIAETQKQKERSDKFNEVFGKVEFGSENELIKEGFKTKVLQEVKFDFDENKNFVTFDKEGKVLLNPKKSGQVYDASEYLKDKAIEMDVIKKNQDGNKKVYTPTFQNQAPNPDAPKKMINPKALQ